MCRGASSGGAGSLVVSNRCLRLFSRISAFGHDFGTGGFKNGVGPASGWLGEGGAAPGGFAERTLPAELEETLDRSEGERHQAEQAPRIHAHGQVHLLVDQVDGPFSDESGGRGGGQKVPGKGNAILEDEGGRGVTGLLVAELLAQDRAQRKGEGAEDGNVKELSVAQADHTLAIQRIGSSGEGGEINASGDLSLRGFLEFERSADLGEVQVPLMSSHYAYLATRIAEDSELLEIASI